LKSDENGDEFAIDGDSLRAGEKGARVSQRAREQRQRCAPDADEVRHLAIKAHRRD
jgi:hypothetical protein